MLKRLAFLLLSILILPTAANAGESFSFVQHPAFSPAACDNDAINTALNCEVSNGTDVKTVWGWSLATFEIKYTWAAGTGYTFHFEECSENSGTYANDCTDSTDWSPIAAQAVSGNNTSLGQENVIGASGVSASVTLTWTVKLNYRRLRLAAITASGSPSSGDKIGVTVTLARGQ